MPALSRPRSSVLGRRPVASSTCDPMVGAGSCVQSTPAAIWLPRFSIVMQVALRRIVMPSRSMMFLISARDLLVFARDEPVLSLQDGDLAAEAAIHLRELQPDVAAADHDEMLGQKVDVHHGGVVEIGDLVETLDGRNDGAAADVDEDLVGGETIVANYHNVGVFKTRLTFVDIDVGLLAQTASRRLPATDAGFRLCAP